MTTSERLTLRRLDDSCSNGDVLLAGGLDVQLDFILFTHLFDGQLRRNLPVRALTLCGTKLNLVAGTRQVREKVTRAR